MGLTALVIGLGRVGWKYSTDAARGLESSHLGAYMKHPKIDTVIAVDNDKTQLESVNNWAKQVNQVGLAHVNVERLFLESDYVEAVKKHKPDIVSVCVPTPQHLEVMIDICHKDGPSVICLEKPVGSSLDETNQIANRAAYIYGLTNGKPKVCVHFDRRWHPNWRRVKELLDKNEIGTPLLAVGHHPGPLLRSGIHMVDLFDWYFGEVKMVQSLSLGDSWMTKKYPETDDVAYNAQIVYKNGVRAFLLGQDLAEVDYQLFELEILGEKGAVHVFDNGNFVVTRLASLPRKTYGGLKGLSTSFLDGSAHLFDQRAYDWVTMDEPVNTMPLLIDDLVQAAETPQQHQLASGLEDGVRAQILVSLIRQSNMNWLSVDEVDLKEVVKTQ